MICIFLASRVVSKNVSSLKSSHQINIRLSNSHNIYITIENSINFFENKIQKDFEMTLYRKIWKCDLMVKGCIKM